MPLWPLLEAGALKVFGAHLSVAMGLNAVIGALVAWQAGALARDVAGQRAGRVAGVVVAIYPPLVANDVVPLSEPLGLLLLVVTIRLLGARRLTWAALTTGLFVMTKNGAVVGALGALVLVLVLAGWRTAVKFLGVVTLVVAPWLVRNEAQVHSPVVTTSIGFNIAAVYSEQAQQAGGYFDDPMLDVAFSPWWPQQTNEAQWDAALERLGLHGLRSDPLRVIPVAANNVASLMGLHNQDGPELLDGRVIRLVHDSMPIYYGVTLLGLGGLFYRRRSPVVRALLAVVGPLLCLSMLTIYAPRLRAPFDLACAIGVGLLYASSHRLPADQPVETVELLGSTPAETSDPGSPSSQRAWLPLLR